MRVEIFAAALAGLIACQGGSGGTSDEIVTQDPSAKSNESVAHTGESSPSTRESVAKTGEAANGGGDVSQAGGGGALSCQGTYTCVTTGLGDQDRTSTLPLSGANGTCTNKGGSINPDGTVTDDKGEVVGQWSGNDQSFTITSTDTEVDTAPDGTVTPTTVTVTVTCTKN